MLYYRELCVCVGVSFLKGERVNLQVKFLRIKEKLRFWNQMKICFASSTSRAKQIRARMKTGISSIEKAR